MHSQAFKRAVHQGHITWHAMPYNPHYELFDPPLLRYALNLTHSLDSAFGLPRKASVKAHGTLGKGEGARSSRVLAEPDGQLLSSLAALTAAVVHALHTPPPSSCSTSSSLAPLACCLCRWPPACGTCPA